MARSDQPTTSGRDRLAQMQAQQRKSEKKKRLALIAGGVAAVVALGGGIGFLATRDSGSKDDGGTASSDIQGMKTWNNLGRDHVEGDPTFPMTPPAGGNHNQAWANCGVYDKKIPDKYAVHSLEHGAVWITTDKASSGDISKLKKLAGQDYMLMSQYPGQGSKIVLTAWGHQLKVDNASDPRIKKFIDAYLQGPQTPEPGAACSGAYDPNTGKLAGQM